MRKAFYSVSLLLLALGSTFITGCPNSSYGPSSPGYSYTSTPSFTPSPSGPTSTPSKTATATPSATITNTPTITATSTVTSTPTNSPTSTSTGTPTNSQTPTNTATITDTPTLTATSTITDTPTITATFTPTATITNTPVVITLSISSGTLGSYSGFYYTGGSGTNNTSNGLYSLAINVGDVVNFPSGGIHTLYLDNGVTCFSGFSGETSASMPYTFTSSGTYYFQCGVHAQGCTKTSCSSTNCTGMAGVITVSP